MRVQDSVVQRTLGAADDVTERFLDSMSNLANAIRFGADDDVAREYENAVAAVGNLRALVDLMMQAADLADTTS